jgi:ketosteroid isomerase-like protein
MKRWIIVAFAIWQFGCSSTPTPAPDTRAAEEKAIRELEAQWMKDLQAKDLDKDVAHYDNDASFLLADMPIVTGKTSITGVHKEMMADPNFALEFSPSKVEIAKSGDMAYSQGVYTLTSTGAKSKKSETVKGKYITVYKKDAQGSWKAVQDMLSEDAPPMVAKGEKPVKAAKAPAKKGKKGKK